MEHYVQVGQPSVLCNMDRLLLLPHPTLAKTHAKAVHCVIPIGVNKVHWVPVGKLLIINVCYWSWTPHTIHTPHFNTRWVEITSEVPGILPNMPGTNKRIKEVVK